jgi:SMODS-associated and fused to various effectors sensor domain
MKKLFICYHSAYRAEVDVLAQELRLRGIPVWLDHDEGFALGDNCAAEARRVISDPNETFGLLLYASPEALGRDFIKRIELDEALRRKERDSEYLLVAVPRGMNFATFSDLCRRHLGEDISKYHTHSLIEKDAEGIHTMPLRPQLVDVARMVLVNRVASIATVAGADETIGINLCTRDHLMASPDDSLDIDATGLFSGTASPDGAWPQLLSALRDIKQELRKVISVPRLRVRGSKHLTAAFLFGRMFPPSTVRELQVQQGRDLWSSGCTESGQEPLTGRLIDEASNSDRLFVEITATDKSVRDSVRRFIQQQGIMPLASLRIEPVDGLRRGSVIDSATACAMALQIRSAILQAVSDRPVREIHLFCAVPQGLMLLIGHHMNATLPIQLYEFDGENYHPSVRLTVADFQ